MRSRLGILMGIALALSLSTSLFAKGKGSNPQFPAPAPAEWYDHCDGSMEIDWTAVTNNFDASAPTKYAIQIIQTFHSSCPDGPVSGTQVNTFTAPGNTTEFTTPAGILQFGEFCSPDDDVVVLVKALNPPGKSQNNPQAVADFVGFGC